jgi:S-DNA-T family DNA segregation ATPase FtsK/SpoIIIE
MAFQTKQREPIFDNHIRLIIDKRSREMFGLFLIGFGLLFSIILFSYNPEDPSWLSSSSKAPTNYFGTLGASISSVLFMIIGSSAWFIPIILVVWGLRFLFHKGWSKAFGRLIYSPLAVAIICVFASTNPTPANWNNPFGFGGLFGEMVLGLIKSFLFIDRIIEERALTLGLFTTSLCIFLFVLGFNLFEMKKLTRSALKYLSVSVRAFSSIFSLLFRALIFSFEKRKNYDQDKKRKGDIGPIYSSYSNRLTGTETNFSSTNSKGKVFSRIGSFILGFFRKGLQAEEKVKREPVIAGVKLRSEDEDRIRLKISSIIESRNSSTTEFQNLDLEKSVDLDLDDQFVEDIFTNNDATDQDIRENNNTQNFTDDFHLSNESDWPRAEAKKAVIKYPLKKKILPSKKAKEDLQPFLKFEDINKKYELPPLSVLSNPKIIERQQMSDDALEENARMLEAVLDDYGVKGEIVSVRPGPVVTMYELEPAPGLKASRVVGLSDDIARSMSALSARVSTVPGRSVIGIELPNVSREMVVLKEILSSRDFGDGKQQLALALGKDIGGRPIVSNLAKMPHLLIAGTTGSGKSVAINTMILSLLYKLSPDQCRMIMIDPKMLELSVYDGIPHLLSPVVTDPKKAVVALKWVVGEMEERYRKMSKMGVRNIDGFNSRVNETLTKGEMFSRTVQTGFDDKTGNPIFETEEFKPEKMPYIVVIVDEMADLMMVAGKEIEACIQRLAQMARASGIHLIMATQRPSVDVITGTIKANFPTRISFQVTSKIDSRTILGEMGAEQLLGMGDMLYMAGGSKITRVHGPFVSDEEVEEVVSHLKSFGPPEYMSSVLESFDDDKSQDIDLVLGLGANATGDNTLYDTAVQIVISDRKCSTSYIQRKLAIGYNKAAKIVEEMEEAGLVSPANHVGKREILVPER